MKQPHESQPNFDEFEQFNELIKDLEPQIQDPYITRLHAEAHELQAVWEEALDLDRADPRQEMIRKSLEDDLDGKWRYMGKMIEVTGMMQKLVKKEDGRQGLVSEFCVGERVKSNGFHVSPGDPRFYHHVFFLDEQGVKTGWGIIAVDDIQQLTLPEPSAEARVQEFAYYFPDEAEMLDDIAFEARRSDQVIADLADFNFYYEPGDEQGMRTITNLNEYLAGIASIDEVANYRMTMIGEFIAINDKNEGMPSRFAQPHTATVRVNSVVMRPDDIAAQPSDFTQSHNWVPYVDVTILKPNGDNVDALVPCVSIYSLHNLRFSGPPKS